MEIKKQLIEEVGIVLETHVHLSPLAARIYATLTLSPKEGLNFIEIINITKASKSAISNSLNILLQLRFVEFYTKSGERKRYFKTSQFFINNIMRQHQLIMEKELQIVQKINAFNKENNPEKFKNEESIGFLFQEYLEEQGATINEKLIKIEAFQNQA